MQSPNNPLFTFRVLIEWSSDYNVFVARCLETGSVATAADQDTAEDMIQELLIDEVTLAVAEGNLVNLYHPAPFEVWLRFQTADQSGAPSKPMHRAIRATNEEVPAEIKIARSS